MSSPPAPWAQQISGQQGFSYVPSQSGSGTAHREPHTESNHIFGLFWHGPPDRGVAVVPSTAEERSDAFSLHPKREELTRSGRCSRQCDAAYLRCSLRWTLRTRIIVASAAPTSDQMKRRQFIAFVVGAAGGVAVARPFALRAQQATPPVIGVLSARSSDSVPHLLDAFRKGLKEAGYSEGQNLKIELRWAEGHYHRLPALAAELVQRRVAVIAAFGWHGPTFAKAREARICCRCRPDGASRGCE